LRYGLQVPQSQFDLYSWVNDDEPDCNATTPVIWPGQTTGYSCRRQGWALLGMMDSGACGAATATHHMSTATNARLHKVLLKRALSRPVALQRWAT